MERDRDRFDRQKPDRIMRVVANLGRTAGVVPDSQLDMSKVPTWDPSMRWFLAGFEVLTGVAGTDDALVAFDFGGVATESLFATPGRGVEDLWFPAPPRWSGSLLVRTATQYLGVAPGSPQFPVQVAGWAAPTGSPFVQLTLYGYRADRAGSESCQ